MPLAFLLPLGCATGLTVVGLLPVTAQTPPLQWAVFGAAIGLAIWTLWLGCQVTRRSRALAVRGSWRPQHYIQASAQLSVLLYWGWYWREVYAAMHLFGAQLLFAYGFDLLLTWSRRDRYRLGLGPVPVVFSLNLFLWFRAEWFAWQFATIALGFMVKEFCRWERDGRRVHIFNPSSFTLAVCAVGLIMTDTTELTWGQEIATTLNEAPHIYALIFLVSLPAQLRFGVATMTMSAVLTMYLFGLAYYTWVGTFYFVDAYIPIAVFLGMHLLFTDPSTSPRTERGRVLFGVLYACSVVALYAVLGALGAPTFYDKLLAVPVMNVLVRGIDRVVRSGPPGAVASLPIPAAVAGPRRRMLQVGLWIVVFVAMSAARGVGDTHRGQWVTFWRQACHESRLHGCRQFGLLVSTYCERGSGWACNEYALLVQPERRPQLATDLFRRACELGFRIGCVNLDAGGVDVPRAAPPMLVDYAIVLRGGSDSVAARTPLETYRVACTEGFVDGCRRASRLERN